MLLLLEEEEEDDELLITTQSEQREKVDALFLNRKAEGYFEILIDGRAHRSQYTALGPVVSPVVTIKFSCATTIVRWKPDNRNYILTVDCCSDRSRLGNRTFTFNQSLYVIGTTLLTLYVHKNLNIRDTLIHHLF